MGGSTTYTMTVVSNDGNTTLFKGLFTQSQTVTINNAGFSSNQLTYSMILTGYTGFATSPNASTPTYSIGQSVNVSATNTTWYLVGTPQGGGGGEVSPAHLTIAYNGSDIVDMDANAEETKTLTCSGKLMTSNVAVTITPGVISQYATGSVTTGSDGFASINCGFNPDIIIIETNPYLESPTTFYPNVELPMYRLPAASNIYRAEGIAWGSEFSWSTDDMFLFGCSAYKISDGATMYSYIVTYDFEYIPAANITLTWKAYKFMGGST